MQRPDNPTPYEIEVIRQIIAWHRHPSLFSRALAALGAPVEKLVDALPDELRRAVGGGVEAGLRRCLSLSRMTFTGAGVRVHGDLPLEQRDRRARRRALGNRLPVLASGAATGFLGPAGALVDIPFSITVFFRNIQVVCACYGVDPADPANAPYYLWLLSSGSPSPRDDASASGYIMTRLGLGLVVKEAQQFVAANAGRGLGALAAREGAPVLVRLVNTVLSRLGVQMTEKIAASAVPVAGAVSAAAINAAFSRDIHANALMAGRLRFLAARYGDEAVGAIFEKEGAPALAPGKAPARGENA